MNPTIPVNKRVDVVVSFKKKGDLQELCFPCKMRYQREEITFAEIGLRHPTSQGQRMIHVFDMTDGSNDYRLEFDAQALSWTLLAIVPGSSK